MIKKFLASITLLFSLAMAAQSGTSSPYSFYGIGDVTFKGTLENRTMGGVSVFADSIHMNLQNPASFAGLGLTSFTVGSTTSNTKFATNSGTGDASRTSIDYIALALPMGKFSAAFGLMPYSSVGYKLQSLAQNENETSRRFEGKGGLNKAMVAFAYKLTPKLNIGVDFNYNFGEITTSSLEFIPQAQFGSRERNISEMAGITANAGLMFHSKLKNKMDVFASFVVTPESKIRLSNERNIATIAFSESSGEVVVDDLDVEVDDTNLRLPAKISFGGGIGTVRKWLIGTEITFRQSSNLGSRFNDISNVSYENSEKYSLGGYYIPNYNSYSSYFKRVTYRGGLRYEKTGLIIANKSIEDMAVSLGMGLPVGGSFSNINLGVEFGRRGTQAAGLVRENYTNFSISLSLNDKWFVKRRYD